jgi:hypothetical protein
VFSSHTGHAPAAADPDASDRAIVADLRRLQPPPDQEKVGDHPQALEKCSPRNHPVGLPNLEHKADNISREATTCSKCSNSGSTGDISQDRPPIA